ncbi:MAG: RdgB/HAM1 family non-canonical purine NTP pyrophosphatase [Nevskiales bacterium]|nr:RdgB/HAM1 family non-canonical purine NTP pyrophosphatase [Nevskiales bacterium]
MPDVVFASRNGKKLAELQALLEPLNFHWHRVSEFSADGVEETAPTFIENALLKARHAAKVSGLPALADDSGIVVDALNGAPGIHSARYAGPRAGDAENNTKLLQALAGIPDEHRGAHYVCVMVFIRHPDDPLPVVAQGRWRGRILLQPRGHHGFGYDPLFFVGSHGQSAAELDPALKNRLSHRARAAAQLIARWRDG